VEPLINCLPVAHNYKSSIRFEWERNGCDGEFDCDVSSMSFFVKLLNKLKMATILRFSFLKEGRDDFLDVSDGNFNFFPSIFFSFVKNFLKPRTDIREFTLFVSNAN
jgi:hypothetical protein